MRGNSLIVQSGGPTAVINNSLYGIIEKALQSSKIGKVLGARRGIYGLLNRDYIDFSIITKKRLLTLRNTPGAALGSWRYQLNDEDIDKIVANMQADDIRYLFYIGGNGSMQVAHMINLTAKRKGYEMIVIGIPKTVDNDLMHTDHSPGYGSAAKFLATSVLDIGMDIMSLPRSNRITIVETMGRNTGWLAASSSLAGKNGMNFPHLIYIPESPFSIESFFIDINRTYKEYGYALVVVSEGIKDKNGKLIAEDMISTDAVGRPWLGGVASYLSRVIQEETDLSARYILSSIWQRSGMLISSKVDAEEAYLLGKKALQYAEQGLTGILVTLQRITGDSYRVIIGTVPLIDVAGAERLFPIKWYDEEKRYIKKEFTDYVSPLIQGEVIVPLNNGLPVYQNIIL